MASPRIVVLTAAAGCQIALNVVRIYLMALSDDMYLIGTRVWARTFLRSSRQSCGFDQRLRRTLGIASLRPPIPS